MSSETTSVSPGHTYTHARASRRHSCSQSDPVLGSPFLIQWTPLPGQGLPRRQPCSFHGHILCPCVKSEARAHHERLTCVTAELRASGCSQNLPLTHSALPDVPVASQQLFRDMVRAPCLYSRALLCRTTFPLDHRHEKLPTGSDGSEGRDNGGLLA